MQILPAGEAEATPPIDALAAPMALNVADLGGALGVPTLSVKPVDAQGMAVSWSSTRNVSSTGATVTVDGSLDCTGYLLMNVTVSAGLTSTVPNAGLELAVAAGEVPFAMGLGRKGGLMDSWLNAGQADQTSWLVFDFGAPVAIDGFRLYVGGNGGAGEGQYLQCKRIARLHVRLMRATKHFVFADCISLNELLGWPGWLAG